MRTNSIDSMKHLFALLLVPLLLAGCSRNYVITLDNGSRITTNGKPKLESGAYVFENAQGRPTKVPAGRVREIAPASMAQDEKSPFIK